MRLRSVCTAAGLSLALVIAACGGPSTAAEKENAADFVFTNGKVYTVDKANSWAEAVAVRGNEIVYVGDNAGAAALVGDGTEAIDPHDIHNTKVELTMMDGVVRHRDGN